MPLRYARQAGGYVHRRRRLTAAVSAAALAAVIGASVGASTGSGPPAGAAGHTQVSPADLSHDPRAHACIYTMRSEWPAVRAAVHKLPDHMRSQVRWWIADPTGIPHVVPGASATQWYWGQHFDVSTANPDF